MPHVRANGIDIEYESFGRESDPLILLIMGFAAQLILWPEALCEGLAAKGFRVVRFDNRDVGKSTHLAGQPAPDPRALFAEVMAGRRPARSLFSGRHGRRRRRPHGRARRRARPYRRRLDGRHDRPTGRDQSSATGRRASSRSCPPPDGGICRRGTPKRCRCCSARRTARAATISLTRAFSCKRRCPVRAFHRAKRRCARGPSAARITRLSTWPASRVSRRL